MSIRKNGLIVGGLSAIDDALDSTSENPVQNKVVAGKFNQMFNIVQIPSSTTAYTLSEGNYVHSCNGATTYTFPDMSDMTKIHEIVLEIEFPAFSRSSSDDSGSAYAWKNGSTILYTSTETPVAGTTVAYSDTSLESSAGTVAAYDSSDDAMSMVASYEFEDESENTIVPIGDSPEIKPGSTVTFFCRWSSTKSKWCIVAIPMD